MFGRIILGLFISAIGACLIYFSANILEFTGRIPWAERNLGSTQNGIVLLGFVTIIIGILLMFGVLGSGSPLDEGLPGTV